jgi:hypothetical protein
MSLSIIDHADRTTIANSTPTGQCDDGVQSTSPSYPFHPITHPRTSTILTDSKFLSRH